MAIQAAPSRGLPGTGTFPPHLRPEHLRFQLGSPAEDAGARAQVAAGRVLGGHGVVGRCHRLAAVDGLPALPVCVAVGPRRDVSGRRFRLDVTGTGVSEVAADARVKAIAEAVEHYCFVVPHDPSRILRASYEQVADWAVPVERFGVLSDAQYQAFPSLRLPERHDEIDWTWAWSLSLGCFRLVPAALAFTSVGSRPPNNFTPGLTTTGVASHLSVEAALLAGLYEVVERDALMIHWFNRRTPRRIVLAERIPADLAHLVHEQFTLPDIDVSLLDMTLDSGLATVLGVARSDSPRRPALVVGSATRAEPVEAARKALFEVAQILVACNALGLTNDSAFAPSAVRSLEDHARLYACREHVPLAGFLTEPAGQVGLGDLPARATGSVAGDLAMAVERVRTMGLEVLAVELTPPDVARSGFRTFRVLVPGTVDINGDVRFPRLGSPRIHEVPAAMGWDLPGALNVAPCPLS